MPKEQIQTEREVTETVTDNYYVCDSCGMEGSRDDVSTWGNRNYDNNLYFCDGCFSSDGEMVLASGSVVDLTGWQPFGSWKTTAIGLGISTAVMFSIAGYMMFEAAFGFIMGPILLGMLYLFVFPVTTGVVKGIAQNTELLD